MCVLAMSDRASGKLHSEVTMVQALIHVKIRTEHAVTRRNAAVSHRYCERVKMVDSTPFVGNLERLEKS